VARWGLENELEGYAVEASDGELGTVRGIGDAELGRYVVVETRRVLGRDVILPAEVIERVDEDARRVYVTRTRDEIKNAPPVALEHRTPEHERQLLEYYGRWHAGS
jgi:hypothetical protein